MAARIRGEGRDVDDAGDWCELLDRLGLADGDAVVNEPQVKEKLRRETEDAISRGVFGVPTVIAEGELFWGCDALPMLIDYLESPEKFDTPEMRRVSDLPVGLQRKT